MAVGTEEVHQQLDQVHRLGVAHDAAVDQNGVAAEEAAHGAERQVAVQVDMVIMGELFHGICPFLCKHSGYQYSTAAGKGKGKFPQKRGERAHIRVDIGKVCGKIRLYMKSAMKKMSCRLPPKARWGECEPVGNGAAAAPFEPAAMSGTGRSRYRAAKRTAVPSIRVVP